MHEIISEFKQQYQIVNTQKIYASLAVDALYFKPDVKVNQNGIITGMTTNR